MSMFDHINIDNKWITPERARIPEEEQCYQTKSFNCNMDHYDVLEDGVLLKLIPGNRFESMGGGDKYVSVNFTGPILFYDDTYEFRAVCSNGVVISVEEVCPDL